MIDEKFNYCVGFYWEEDGAIGTYTYLNNIFYGTLDDANNFLTYVKGKNPERDYKIFKLEEYVNS
jgi:hypothetical protein